MLTLTQVMTKGVAVALDADGLYGTYDTPDFHSIMIELDYRAVRDMKNYFPVVVRSFANDNYRKMTLKVQQVFIGRLKLDQSSDYDLGVSHKGAVAQRVIDGYNKIQRDMES